MRLAGHCIRHPDTIANLDLFWMPKHGKKGRGRPKKTFIDNIKEDTGLDDLEEIRSIMMDRKLWRAYQ